jgi:hypothetical protein
MAETIQVTAGKGRRVPLDPSVATAPGNRVLFLEADQVIEVDPLNTHVVRALADGDLVRVESAPAKGADR